MIGRFMGPIWGRQEPGGPHVGLMIFAIWVYIKGYKNVIITNWWNVEMVICIMIFYNSFTTQLVAPLLTWLNQDKALDK